MGFLRGPEARQSIILYAVFNALAIGCTAAFSAEALAFATAVCALFDLLALLTARRRYQKISALSDEIGKILHGQESYDLDQFSEGELSILQSELVKMTVCLREQAELLKKDKLYLSNSLADISHQIKTPLTSLHLAVDLLSASDLTEERRQSLIQDIDRSLSRIDWLISSLLKLSQLDAGTVVLRKEPVNVSALVHQATAPLAISMELRGQSLITDIPEETSFAGDWRWSAEALSNVIKNCVEHTPEGGSITVTGRENAIFTEIRISDTGSGFAPEDIPHLFERFYKGRGASAQSVGIGLALSRTIISRQNGSISAKNTPAGAEFCIRFYRGTV